MELLLQDSVQLLCGDSRELIKSIPDESIDSAVMDPPYALVSIGKRFGKSNLEVSDKKDMSTVKAAQYKRLSGGFMGQKWDTGETAFAVEFWAEVLRVLKPGAHVAVFSGTRTYHRLAVAIEDAGFEIRDQLAWVYGSGFPKSHNVGKAPQAAAWHGWGTALKPAWEPICLARKPLDGTVAANVLEHGTGALNIDGCRVAGEDTRRTNTAEMGYHGGNVAAEYRTGSGRGRWPANIIHDDSDEVLAAFPETSSGVPSAGDRNGGVYGDFAQRSLTNHGASSGSAARFFYTAKADGDDRLGSKHPTVKPVDLMQWLCRLVTPPGGVALDCFAGTGTTGEAAWREGFRSILMEREERFQDDIRRRMLIAPQHSAARKTVQKAAGGPSPHIDFFGDE